MPSRYFSNFPKINYFSANAVDITDRVIFPDNTLKNPYVFYPYDLTDSERADQFANRYYGDSYKAWILYLGNQIVDPYYEWYLSNDQFQNFINLKYGNYQLAQSKIKYYENNWYNDRIIDVNDFDSLPNSLLKYWQPIYDSFNNIISYQRVQSNDTITTNGIRSYIVSNTSFNVDEVVNINYNLFANNVGQGQVMSLSGNILYIQHISGNTISNTSSNSYIYGTESQVNTFFSNPSIVCDNLLPEEEIYWSPVSYLQYETNKNEEHKTIKVLDKNYAPSVANGLKNLLAK